MGWYLLSLTVLVGVREVSAGLTLQFWKIEGCKGGGALESATSGLIKKICSCGVGWTRRHHARGIGNCSFYSVLLVYVGRYRCVLSRPEIKSFRESLFLSREKKFGIGIAKMVWAETGKKKKTYKRQLFLLLCWYLQWFAYVVVVKCEILVLTIRLNVVFLFKK